MNTDANKFESHSRYPTYFATLLLAAFAVGCDGGGSGSSAGGNGGGAKAVAQQGRVANARKRAHAVAKNGKAVCIHVGKAGKNVGTGNGACGVFRAMAHVDGVGFAARGVCEGRADAHQSPRGHFPRFCE